MSRLRQINKQRGDTIVEVLIAIAVISLVLGGAFVTTNRSLQATRAAEERGNAIKLVESQIEQLKTIAKTDSNSLFGAGVPNPFCVGANQTIVAANNAACRVNAAGQPTETEPIYNLSVSRSGNTFTISNNWQAPGGRHTDRVQMVYRMYP